MSAPTAPARIEPGAIYTAAQAAAAISVHPKTLARWLRAGVLRGNRKLGSWRILGAELLKTAAA